jgi:hypothetical protein
MKKLVVVESPYAGRCDPRCPWPISSILKWIDRRRNIRYLRKCLRDSIMRGEAPFASHAIYTQPGVLRDDVPEARACGIAAGLEWGTAGHMRAVYIDRGITGGMEAGIKAARMLAQPVVFRMIHQMGKKEKKA